MKLKLNLKTFTELATNHTTIVLWIFLLVILLAEGFVLKNSVGKYLASGNPAELNSAQVVRVNFETYQKIEDRLKVSEAFIPEPVEGADTYGLVIKEQNP